MRNERMTTARLTIAGPRQRTHVLYVVSWVRRFIDTTGSSVSLVELGERDSIAAEFGLRGGLTSGLDGVEVRGSHRSDDGPHFLICIGAPANKALFRLQQAEGRRRMRVVVIDEGIGSYGSWSTRRRAMRREGTVEPWATLRSAAVQASRRFIPQERWALYVEESRGTGTSWTLNDGFADELRRHTADCATSDTVVYLAQPWVDHGSISAVDYFRHLDDLAATIAPSGLRFQVRPHPTEPAERYRDFDALDTVLPAEIDPALTSARLVIGETSTALLNLAAVHGVDARRVAGPLTGLDALRLSRRQASLFETFVPPPVSMRDVAKTL